MPASPALDVAKFQGRPRPENVPLCLPACLPFRSLHTPRRTATGDGEVKCIACCISRGRCDTMGPLALTCTVLPPLNLTAFRESSSSKPRELSFFSVSQNILTSLPLVEDAPYPRPCPKFGPQLTDHCPSLLDRLTLGVRLSMTRANANHRYLPGVSRPTRVACTRDGMKISRVVLS